VNWRKSTYSSDTGGACVEVASGAGAVLVRDTTDRGGPSLAVTPGAWRAFLSAL
jgi:hypothetical protein